MAERRRRWLRRVGLGAAALLALFFVGFFVSTDYGAAFGSEPEGARLTRMQASPRYRAGEFANTRPTRLMGFSDAGPVMREFLFGNAVRVPEAPLPVFPHTSRTIARKPASGLRVTWLGHSTLLIEIDDTRLLTDPVFSERSSPSTWVGPSRFHPVPLALAGLGALDAVLISHDHYDHLDHRTIQELAKTGVRFLVPLGVGAHLEGWGVAPERIIEHDIWQESSVGNLLAVATPAQHFSGRGLFDRNRTLWCSWTLIGERHRVFFSGDTGLDPEFSTIGERFGPFDVAMLEVGAYHPSWGDIHLGPEKALEAFRQLRARSLLPVHWGTFDLALHAWAEPAETLFAGAKRAGVLLHTPRVGESVEPSENTPTGPWWRAASGGS